MSSVFIPNPDLGQIQIIFGPMFSGKTTELMRRLKRYQIANYRCLIVKYAKDNRYDCNGIATHDRFIASKRRLNIYINIIRKRTLQHQITIINRQILPAVSCERLSELQSEALKHDIIGIDEGQFFPDIVSFCDKLANQGKVVIVAALDGTFQKKGFGDILNLVPLAEHVMKLTAVCLNCYKEASFTKRKGSETEIEVIGGADKYIAVCRQCFTSPKKSRSPLKAMNINSNSADIEAVSKHLFSSENIENYVVH